MLCVSAEVNSCIFLYSYSWYFDWSFHVSNGSNPFNTVNQDDICKTIDEMGKDRAFDSSRELLLVGAAIITFEVLQKIVKNYT